MADTPRVVRLAAVFASIASLALISPRAVAQDDVIDPGAGARIGMRVVDGDGQFYRLSTGETWIPRGTNLMRFDRGGRRVRRRLVHSRCRG